MNLFRFSFLVFIFMPFMAFAVRCRIPYFTAAGSTSYNSFSADSVDELYGFYFSSDIALFFKGGNMISPSYSIGASSNGSLLNSQIATNGNLFVSSPLDFPDSRLPSVFYACASLYATGYSGVGLKSVFKSSSNTYININLRDSMIDILSSTNTTYHQVLFSSLSGISHSISNLYNSIININTDVSSLQSDFRSVNLPVFDFSKYLEHLVETGAASQSNVDNWQSNFDQYSYDSELQLAYAQSVQRFIDYNNQAERTLKTLQDSAQGNPSQLRDIGSAFNGSVDASVNDFKRLSTNWQEGVKKDLQDWRNDVTNRLAHMFDDNIPIDGGNTTPVYVSGLNGNPVSVSGVVRIDQEIPVGVTISSPITIDPTQFNQFSSGWESIVDAVKSFHDYFTDWASNGNIGFGWVRYYFMMDDFRQNTLTNQLAKISLLSSLTNLFTNYAENFTNNVIFSISNSLAGLTSVSNDYMLLSDYANYINSHGLVDLIDVMDDDTYSALKDELFGISSLDQADSYGRWWRYFTGLETINANSNYKLANLFIGHDKTLKDLKDSSGSDSLLDKFQQLFELIPSPTDIMDKTGNMTNSIDSSGFVSLLDQSSSMSNYFNRVEMFFNRGSSLPANISINLGFGNKPGLNNAQPIVLPLDKYRGVMDLLHYGIAFSYCIVNLILLPKFLLILIHLFDRVWKGYDKKLSDAVQA